MQNYRKTPNNARISPIFYNFAENLSVIKHFLDTKQIDLDMKYLVATFNIETSEELIQTSRELLADSAAEAGFESFEDTDNGLEGYVQKELFDKELLDQGIADFPIEGVKISYEVKEAEYKDWNQEWEEQGFAPIYVGDRVVIYDAKHPELYPIASNQLATTDSTHAENPSEIIEIGIEAKLAFGTGNHETTRMVISQLLQMPIKTKRILDCGTGTGILALAASKMGAKECVGYDIDEWSVENAKHNAVLNGVDNLEVFFGNAQVVNHISGMFDIVVANINRNILLEDMRTFRSVMSPGASLVLSGFYEEDIPLLLEKAKELGLHETTRQVDNHWACLILNS